MTQSSIPVLVCDRCGERSEARHHTDHYAWGRVHAEQVNGPHRIGGGGQKPVFKDLCPDCLRGVITWFEKGKHP